jgi:hypothetical protein
LLRTGLCHHEWRPPSRGGQGILTVEIESLAEGHRQALDELVAGGLLAVDTRQLLDPPDPPCAVLLDHGSELVVHLATPSISAERGVSVLAPECTPAAAPARRARGASETGSRPPAGRPSRRYGMPRSMLTKKPWTSSLRMEQSRASSASSGV